MDAVLDPFRTGIGLRALIEVVLLGLVCGPLGAWIVLHRQSFAAESMSHGMLPGLVLAALVGVPIVLGAVGGVLVAALAIAAAGRDERLGVDAGVAVAVTALVGAGSVLALAPRAPARLEELLFGDPLGVMGRDLAIAAALVAVAAVGLAVAHRRLTAAAFDPAVSTSLGARPDRAQLVLLILIAGVIAVSAQALGNLLAVALILGPGAAGVAAGQRLPAVLGISTAGAVAAGIAGLELSFHASVATGASIALCAVAVAVVGAALPRAVISRR